MKWRVLPPDEWSRLEGTLLADVWSELNPRQDFIVVTENGAGEITGCCALNRVWHLDGAWIAPDHRKKGSVGRHLYAGVRALLASLQVTEVQTMAVSEDGKALQHHLGTVTQLDCAHYAVRIIH